VLVGLIQLIHFQVVQVPAHLALLVISVLRKDFLLQFNAEQVTSQPQGQFHVSFAKTVNFATQLQSVKQPKKLQLVLASTV
jgi:hypothetical protein